MTSESMNKTSNSCCFSVKASLQAVRALRSWLRAALEVRGASQDDINAFLTAISELAANVVEHPRPPANRIGLCLRTANGVIEVELRADTNSFESARHLSARVNRHAPMDCESLSGRGLFVALHLFPDLDYRGRQQSDDGLERYRLRRTALYA